VREWCPGGTLAHVAERAHLAGSMDEKITKTGQIWLNQDSKRKRFITRQFGRFLPA
jgi:hypothetical protein